MNPFFKTLLTQFAGIAGGAAAYAVDGALQHPTGGLLATLGAHPDLAIAYVTIANLVHNFVSTRFPAGAPAAAGSTQPAK